MRNEPGDMNQESVLVDSHEKCLNDVTQIVKKPQTRKLFTYFFLFPFLTNHGGHQLVVKMMPAMFTLLLCFYFLAQVQHSGWADDRYA